MAVIHRSKKCIETSLTSESFSRDVVSEEPMGGTQPGVFLLLEDLKHGILPNNRQVQAWLRTASTSPAMATNELSPAGQRLLLDIKQLFQLLDRLLQERNQDEILQRFAYHVSLSAKLTRRDLAKSSRITVTKGPRRRLYFGGVKDTQVRASHEALRKQTRESARTLWQALLLLTTSTDFRQVLSQGRLLFDSLMTSGKQDTVDSDAYETPHAKLFIHKHHLAKARTKAEERAGLDTAVVEDELRSLHSQVTAAHDELERLRGMAGNGSEKENVCSNAAAGRYGNEHTLYSLEFDEEELMSIFKQLCLQINSGQFMPALRQLWAVLTSLQTASPLQGTEPEVVPTELHFDANFKASQRGLLLILERFAPGTSITEMLKDVQEIKASADKDYQLKDFLHDWRSFFERCVRNPEYMDHEEYRSRSHFLLARTNDIFQERYREKFSTVYRQVRNLLDAWDRDELMKDIATCMNKIVRMDLLGASPLEGEHESQTMVFSGLQMANLDLMRDVRSVILPNILRSLSTLPFPRIEAEKDGTRLTLENIVLPAEALLPMDLSIKSRSHLNLHPRQQYLQRTSELGCRTFLRNGTVFRAGQFRAHIPNIGFRIDRADAFPRFKDTGLLDVTIGGKGLSIVVNIEAAGNLNTAAKWLQGGQSVRKRPLQLHPHYVRVSIDRLRMHFHDSGHDNLYAVAAPFIQMATKRSIELAIAERIVQGIDLSDRLLCRISQRKYF